MAMLPQSARTAAAYLGGGVARGIEQQGKRVGGLAAGLAGSVGSAGQQIQSVGQKVGMLGAKEVALGAAGAQAMKGLAQNPLAARVGNFLESVGGGVSNLGTGAGEAATGVGQSMQQFGSNVASNAVGSMKKRDLGLATVGVGLTGAFVGGMGANAGVNQLMGYYQSDPRTRVANEPPEVRGNKMPSDLQQSYLNLAVPGSPLGQMNYMQTPNIKEAQMRQRLLRAAMGPEFVEPENS